MQPTFSPENKKKEFEKKRKRKKEFEKKRRRKKEFDSTLFFVGECG